jgi:hypothetical protein
MRVEEYEHHFMKMMHYALEDTNLERKKQFWLLRGLHRGPRQGLKASEHKTLRHLMNCAIALKDERRSHEDRKKNRMRMGESGPFRPIIPEAEGWANQHHEREFPPRD